MMLAPADKTAESNLISNITAASTELSGYRLSILSGCQQGAVSDLKLGTSISVGNALTNDIVLRGESLEAEHLSITVEPNNVIVLCVNGIAAVDGISLSAGEAQSFSGSGLVQIGDVALSIEGDVLDSPLSAPQSDTALNDVQSSYSESSSASVEELPAPTDDGMVERTGAVNANMAFATIAALLLGAMVVWKSGLFAQDVDEPVALSSLLKDSPFSELRIEQSGNNALVSGFLNTRQESNELNQWLSSSGLHVNNAVIVGDVLADQVLDVFRVHGVSADVNVSAEAKVNVLTRESDVDLLGTINERVILDVPGIASLNIENTPPPVVVPDDKIPLDAGKRVAMVVSDSPAYIVTEDNSRYFVGSWLPTGHRIQSIVDGKVMLEKEGTETMLEF